MSPNNNARQDYYQAGRFLVLMVLLPLIILVHAHGAAMAADLKITLSANALERLLQSASPYYLKYDLVPGTAAAEITIMNPKIILKEGRPGHIYLELDYQVTSPILGLTKTGKTRPEVMLEYIPQRGALKVYLRELRVNVRKSLQVNMDGLIDPAYLPVAPPDPLDLEDGTSLRIESSNIKTEVTPDHIVFEADYSFSRKQPEGSPKQTQNTPKTPLSHKDTQ